jgi:hypothetical protein
MRDSKTDYGRNVALAAPVAVAVDVAVAVALAHKGCEGGGRVGEQRCGGVVLNHAAAAAEKGEQGFVESREGG